MSNEHNISSLVFGSKSPKNIAVIGLGLSGFASLKLLLSELENKCTIHAFDSNENLLLKKELELLAKEFPSLRLHLGKMHEELLGMDLIVLSPGVPAQKEIEKAEKIGIPVWGEIELSVRFLKAYQPHAKMIAVGGTNGKSTVTSLIAACFEKAGFATFAGGNLGEPLATHVKEPFDRVVLEVSSFQMEKIDTFQPDVSLLLNISSDHLDRYSSIHAYAAAKGNAFINQSEHQFAVVPSGDLVCLREASRGSALVLSFGQNTGDVRVSEHDILDTRDNVSYKRSNILLKGGHNALNVAATLCAVRELGVSAVTASQVFAEFEGLPHRMVYVSSIHDVHFYDDSKGTNVGASVTALKGLSEQKAVLIAGGRDKQGGYHDLVLALKERGRAAVLIGEAANAISSAIEGAIPVYFAENMDDAVRKAYKAANKGDAVLLSPACSSLDMFKDYKERGDMFVRSVKTLLAETV